MPRAQQLALALVIAAGCLIVGTLIARDLFREVPVPSVSSVPEAPPQDVVRTAVRVTPTACNRTASGRMQMEGYILNVGTQDLQYVTVKALWKNAAGQVIGSEEFYALNGQLALAPGEQHAFSHSTALSSAARCNAEAVDWW